MKRYVYTAIRIVKVRKEVFAHDEDTAWDEAVEDAEWEEVGTPTIEDIETHEVMFDDSEGLEDDHD